MMKIKTNGNWWQGELVLGYNLKTLMLILGAVLALAATGLLLWGLWCLLGLLWDGLCWLLSALWVGICWLASKWLWLLGAAALAALIWALSRVKWPERKPHDHKEWKAPRWLWWALAALLLLLLAFLLFRSCGSKEDGKISPATPELVTPERYEEQQNNWIQLDCYLSSTFNIKYADYKKFEAYGMNGNMSERLQAFGKSDSYRDWKELFQYVEGHALSNDQLAVVTRYGLWCGLAGFKKSPACKHLCEGSLKADDFSFVYTNKGEKRSYSSARAEAHAKKYAWVLMAVYNGHITVNELMDCPCKSYEALPLEEMYDQTGRYVFTPELKQQLKQGKGKTTREVLGL